jgi:UDP-N-acetylglucosamine--dolichyl-phosphate N-acetylglucosaminephosphotransferase
MVDTLDIATLVVSLIVSLLTTFITVPWLISRLAKRDIMGIDQNKLNKPRIPEMGGLTVLIGFVAGISTFLVINKILKDVEYEFLAATVLAVVGAALAGIMDDLFGLRQRVKAVIPFLFAIPVGVYVADKTTMSFIIGDPVDFGILMMLIAPFGVTCAANAGNMLEGFNGLGTGLGIIISVTLIAISLKDGVTDSLILLFPLLGALIAFLWFNKYPARIFPGDTLTLFVGATIACAAIVGDFKTIGALLFIPMIIEFFLKLRGKFKGENYGTPDEEDYLTYEGDVESLTHYFMKRKRIKEPRLVMILWGIEGVLCAIILTLAYLGLL